MRFPNAAKIVQMLTWQLPIARWCPAKTDKEVEQRHHASYDPHSAFETIVEHIVGGPTAPRDAKWLSEKARCVITHWVSKRRNRICSFFLRSLQSEVSARGADWPDTNSSGALAYCGSADSKFGDAWKSALHYLASCRAETTWTPKSGDAARTTGERCWALAHKWIPSILEAVLARYCIRKRNALQRTRKSTDLQNLWADHTTVKMARALRA